MNPKTGKIPVKKKKPSMQKTNWGGGKEGDKMIERLF